MIDSWKNAWEPRHDGAATPPPLPRGAAPPPLPAPSPPPAVHPLGYVGYGPANPRPAGGKEGSGFIITIAVVSILIALLGLIINVWSSLYWAQMYRGSIPPLPAKITPPPPVRMVPYDGDSVGLHGIGMDLRDAVIAAWEKADGHALSHDRRVMLSRLLADCGADIFPNPDPSGIERSIARVGSVSPGRFGSGRFGQQYMLTANGRIDLDGDVATFTPGAAQPPAPAPPAPSTDLSNIPANLPSRIRDEMVASRKSMVQPLPIAPLPQGAMRVEGTIFIDGAGKTHWSAGAISRRIEDLRQDMQGNLNAIQAAAIITELNKVPASSTTYSRPAFSWRGGHVPADPRELPVTYEGGAPTTPFFNIGYKRVYVLQKGWVLPFNPVGTHSIDPETGIDYPAAPRFVPRLAGSTSAMLALGVETGLGALLAVFLLICGILVLVSQPIGLRLHLIWVPLKIGLLTLCIIATTAHITSLKKPNFSNTRAGNAARIQWYTFRAGLVVHMVLQGIYPTALLIMFFGPLRRFVKRVPDNSDARVKLPYPPYPAAANWAPPPPLRAILLVCSVITMFGASTVHAQRPPRTRPSRAATRISPTMPDPFGPSLRDTPLRVEELAYVNDHQRTVDMGQDRVEQLVKLRPGGVPALIGLMAEKFQNHCNVAIIALSKMPISDADRPLILAHLDELDAVLRTRANTPERRAAAMILLKLSPSSETVSYFADLFDGELTRPLYQQVLAAIPTDDPGRQTVARRMLEITRADPKILTPLHGEFFIFTLEQLGEPGRSALLEMARDPHPTVSAMAMRAFVRPSQRDSRFPTLSRLDISNYPEDQPVPTEVNEGAAALLKGNDPDAAQTALQILAGSDSTGREQVIEYMQHPLGRPQHNRLPQPPAREPLLALQAALPYTRDVAKGYTLCDPADARQVAAMAKIFHVLNQQPGDEAAMTILDLVDSTDADLRNAACKVISQTPLAALAGAHTLHELTEWQPIFASDFRHRVMLPPSPASGSVSRGSAWAPAPLHVPAAARPAMAAATSPWPSVSVDLLITATITGVSFLLIRLAMR